MTKDFIDKLSDKQLGELMRRCHFRTYCDGFRQGTDKFHQDGYLVIHTYDRDYASSKDYDEEKLYLADYDVKHWLKREEYLPIHHKFMIENFGDKWVEKAVSHFEKRKAPKRIALIMQLRQEVEKEKKQPKQEKEREK